MGRNRAPRTKTPQGPDHAIAQIAVRQHGNVTRRQLLALGLSDNDVRGRLRRGQLHRAHRGVYAVGRPPVVALERAAAAVLACGAHAALSHTSALALWGLAKWPRQSDVAVLQGDPRPAGITVHRLGTLHRRDLTTQLGIRTTSPARALLDCAPRLTSARLTRAANDARRRRLCTPAALADLLVRNPNHPGARRLAPFADPDSPVTASAFEDRFVALCRTYGLPMPRLNTYVCGYEVDALFEAQRVIVELDSWEFHGDRIAFVTDRNRDADTLAAGYVTVRLTWERPDDVQAARLHRILAARQ